jgi:extracellular matrix regulatory protein A
MHIGFDHKVPWWEIDAIMAPKGEPQKRLRRKAEQEDRLLDCRAGRRTRAIIITKSNHVILSGIHPETLWPRLLLARERDLNPVEAWS